MTVIYRILYNILISVLLPAVYLFSFFNTKLKANRMGQGRASELEEFRKNAERPVIWLHAASGGEYEQISPLADSLYITDIYALILSVSSTTIYDKCCRDHRFEKVFYNPWDTRRRTLKYVQAVRPAYYINTRHDIWFNLLSAMRKYGIPTVLINANIYNSSSRLKFGIRNFTKVMFSQYDYLFTVSSAQKAIFEKVYDKSVTAVGDTRTDRVLERKRKNTEKLLPETFMESGYIVYGSVIDSDREVLKDYFKKLGYGTLGVKHLIVPHETDEASISAWSADLKETGFSVIRRREIADYSGETVLIWDTVGELADLYKGALGAYVGAGFSTGVHNVMEPAVYGVPVSYGPKYDILVEAVEMADNGLGSVINQPEDLIEYYHKISDKSLRSKMEKEILNFVQERSGAVRKILDTLSL